MKWLIFGANGWIGQQVHAILKTDPSNHVLLAEVRADDEQEVTWTLESVRPDRVISLIGRTHGPGIATIDYLEQPGKLKENVRDNLFGPFVLAMLCQKYKIHLTYMGTGCIFTYDALHCEGGSKGFLETDVPNFFGSSYSTVKGFTDQMMRMFSTVLNVRIRMPITADQHARNFITKITSYSKICSIPNSMTVLPELLPIMLDMAKKRVVGTINLTNPGVISHNEILQMYEEIVDPTFTWENFSQEEQRAILQSDRSNNMLDTTRLVNLYPNVRHIKHAIRDVLTGMKKEICANDVGNNSSP